MEIRSTRRNFATVTRLPWLARLQVRDPDQKPTGVKRISIKTVRLVWSLLHRSLGIAATGTITFHTRGGVTKTVTVDATKSLYIDYASRTAHGGYEIAESMLIDAVLPKTGVFYDIGANWGYFSWLAATNDQFIGQVYSFEIAPDMVRELQDIRRHGEFECVHIQPFGLSSRARSLSISNDRHSHLTRVIDDADAGGRRAEVRRLDDLDLPPPDIIKIDIEDHEFAALSGAIQTISDAMPAILFECRSPLAADTSAVFDLLSNLGYKFFLLTLAETGIRLTSIDASQPDTIPEGCNLFAATDEGIARFFPLSSGTSPGNRPVG